MAGSTGLHFACVQFCLLVGGALLVGAVGLPMPGALLAKGGMSELDGRDEWFKANGSTVGLIACLVAR